MSHEHGEFEYRVTPHICRICFGRVLMRETFDKRKLFRCSNCGVELEGKNEAAICMCGLKLGTKVDAGIRCVPNPEKRPELPNEIIAEQAQPV
jgi:hypothetical protein